MPALRKLALALNSTFEPKLEAELNSISKFAQSNPANWASQKTAISTAANLIQEYYGVEVLKLPALKSQKISALEAALGKMQSDLQSGAIRAFRGFDHASQGSFFDSYPIDLGGKTFFDGKDSIEMLRDLVGAFTGDQLAAFQKKYSAQLEGNAEAKEVFATRYFAALLVSEGTKIPLKRLLSILTTAKEKGLEPKSLPGIKIAFAETTSKTLLKEAARVKIVVASVMRPTFEYRDQPNASL
jgi:hypothetical protein